LVQVFVFDSPTTDLVVLGTFTIELTDGSKTSFDFTARFVIGETKTESGPKLQSVQCWTDPTKMKAAFEKAAGSNREAA
jgi:hypothetical protein